MEVGNRMSGLLKAKGGIITPPIRSTKMYQDGGTPVNTNADTNDLALKGMMKEPMAARAMIMNQQVPGTLGGLMSKTVSTVSPDRKLPSMDNPDVAKVRDFAKSISRPEMGAMLNTTLNPFGQHGWIKNIITNPDVHITFDKIRKAGTAAAGLYNLNKQGYKFDGGGKADPTAVVDDAFHGSTPITPTPSMNEWEAGTQQDINDFKKLLPTDTGAQNQARAYYNKQRLDSALSQQDPEGWKTAMALKARTPMNRLPQVADSLVNVGAFKGHIPASGISKIIGENETPGFNAERDIMNKNVQKFIPGANVSGTGENKNIPASQTAYSLRNSFMIAPAEANIGTSMEGYPRANVTGKTTWNPKTGYSYNYNVNKTYPAPTGSRWSKPATPQNPVPYKQPGQVVNGNFIAMDKRGGLLRKK